VTAFCRRRDDDVAGELHLEMLRQMTQKGAAARAKIHNRSGPKFVRTKQTKINRQHFKLINILSHIVNKLLVWPQNFLLRRSY